MLDNLNESPEDKIHRLDKLITELQVKVRLYGECLEALMPLVFTSKQLADRAVLAIEGTGLQKFQQNGVYRTV